MISLSMLFFLMFSHWVADFICQTDYMARGKSKTNGPLFLHVSVYALVLAPFAFFTFSYSSAFWFLVFNMFLHFIVDFYTSRLSSKLASQNKYGSTTIPNFGMFTVIGFDQFLHLVCLTSTYLFFLNT